MLKELDSKMYVGQRILYIVVIVWTQGWCKTYWTD